MIIAGNPSHVDDVAAVLRRESWLGYTVLGALTTPGNPMTETPAGIPVLGSTIDVLAAIEDVNADVIVFADGAFASCPRPAPDDVGPGEPRRPGHRGPQPHRRLAASG